MNFEHFPLSDQLLLLKLHVYLCVSVEKATLRLDFKETMAEGTYENPAPKRFRRRQSDLYQMIHTSPDPEIEIDLLEPALREVNDQLITEKECEYIFYVRELIYVDHGRQGQIFFSILFFQ